METNKLYVFKIPVQLGENGQGWNEFVNLASRYSSRYAEPMNDYNVVFIPSDITLEKIEPNLIICKIDRTIQSFIDDQVKPYLENTLGDKFKLIILYHNGPGSLYPDIFVL